MVAQVTTEHLRLALRGMVHRGLHRTCSQGTNL
jgi:hypothetical protein